MNYLESKSFNLSQAFRWLQFQTRVWLQLHQWPWTKITHFSRHLVLPKTSIRLSIHTERILVFVDIWSCPQCPQGIWSMLKMTDIKSCIKPCGMNQTRSLHRTKLQGLSAWTKCLTHVLACPARQITQLSHS